MTCHDCTSASTNPHHAIYDRTCAGCGAREVKSARAVGKHHQEQIIGIYGRHGTSRADILERLKGD